MADSQFAQVQNILRAVLASPLFENGSGPFSRTLHVTDAVKDVRVSRLIVEVHPEWAVERGPLDAAKQIREACHSFDERIAVARELRLAELKDQLDTLVESIRRAGAEPLLTATYHYSVSRRRSLITRRAALEVLHFPVPRHKVLLPWQHNHYIICAICGTVQGCNCGGRDG